VGDTESINVLLLDCQTSGRQPASGSLIEIAWAVVPLFDSGNDPVQVHASLVGLGDEGHWSKGAERINQIAREAVESAPVAEEVWAQVLEVLNQPNLALAAAHYARFERSFLFPLHQKITGDPQFTVDFICTHDLAKRLFPELPAYGIRAVSGFFGWELPEVRRSEDHIRATAFIWKHLLNKLRADHAVHTIADFQAWLKTPPVKSTSKKKSYLITRDYRLSAPDQPGIYRMLSKNGKYLYIGKATSLKSRVNSYFQSGARGRTGISEMLAQVHHVEFETTVTPLEAALLEHDAIKKYDPPYNQMLRRADRTLLFRAADFAGYSVKAAAGFPYGPFTSPFAFERFDGWHVLLNHETLDVPLFPIEIEPEQIRAATVRLGERIGITLPDRPDAGELLHFVRQASLRTPYPDKSLDWEALSLTGIGEEDLITQLIRTSHRAIRRLRRATWMARLAFSRIEWERAPGTWRFVEVENAEIAKAGDGKIAARALYPKPSRLEMLACFTPLRYDRMSILVAEIRRLSQTKAVSIFLASGKALRTEQVRQVLHVFANDPAEKKNQEALESETSVSE
jgi:DNA polymerase-3 subunit epsilon